MVYVWESVGFTATEHALNIVHNRTNGCDVCLLVLAKASPRTPHVCFVEWLRTLGAPSSITRLETMHVRSMFRYGDILKSSQGIEEGYYVRHCLCWSRLSMLHL